MWSDSDGVDLFYPYYNEDDFYEYDEDDGIDYEVPNDSDDSDSSEAEPEPISDEEDEEIFGKDEWSRDLYHNELHQIKHNASYNYTLDLEGTTLSSPMFQRIGYFLSTNNVVTGLVLEDCNLTSENFQALVDGGLKDNKSIKKINLGGNVGIGKKGDMSSLSFFLTNNVTGHQSGFQSLDLSRVRFSIKGLEALFSGLNGNPTLRTLDLSHNDFKSSTKLGRTLVSCLSTLRIPSLKALHLVDCQLGLQGCIAISKFLEHRSHISSTSLATLTTSPSSSNMLEELSLALNKIDDECTSVLARTLKIHHTLEQLDISHNEGISQRTFDFFEDVLCDKSSINSICASNHTLKRLRSSHPNMNIEVFSLCNINDYSECPEKALTEKLKRYYFTEKSDFGVGHFENTCVELMPKVLYWISINCKLSGLYHYIRNWNLPTLFSFPSAESMRLRERMDAFEEKSSLLEEENSALVVKNKELAEEISSLKRLVENQKEELIGLQRRFGTPFDCCDDSLVPSMKKRKT